MKINVSALDGGIFGIIDANIIFFGGRLVGMMRFGRLEGVGNKRVWWEVREGLRGGDVVSFFCE